MKEKAFDSYPGGKEGTGVYQQIINLFPPHDVYIEGFLGNGAILRKKKPAVYNFGLDVNKRVIDSWNGVNTCVNLVCTDFMQWMKENVQAIQKMGSVLIYLDPPYLLASRSAQRKLYEVEFETAEQHEKLLSFVVKLPFKIVLSAYENELYETFLLEKHKWSKHTFTGVSQRGKRTEALYYNYPAPVELHEYTYLGKDRRERERIGRKLSRHVKRLLQLPDLERNAIIDAIAGIKK